MPSLPTTKALILEPQGSVLTIRLNRPEAKNSLTDEMVDEIHAVLDVAAQDNSAVVSERVKQGCAVVGHQDHV